MINPVSWAYEQSKRLNKIIWHTPLSEISRGKKFLYKQLRIILLASRGFLKDKVQLRASALTFYSLLSIIPIVAIGFAIAKGFSLDQDFQQLITDKFQSNQALLKEILQISRDALEETRGGYIAGVGMIILFWSGISLLHHIEDAFNYIWEIRSARSWYRKTTDYLTIIIISPVFIILSSSISVFVSTGLNEFMSKAPILIYFKPLISFLIKFAPYFLSWVALTVLFLVMPNTKVKFVPAMISGIISGTILQVLFWLYIDLQFGISKLSAIYGSFAAVPLFIIWLQSSWIIVLLGAELSFAYQNISRYEFEYEALNISNYQKRALVLMIMHLIIRNFSMGEESLSAEKIAGTLKISVRLARDILQDLSSVNLVSVIHENEHIERLYQPALDVKKLTISFVLSRLDKKGAGHIMISKNKNYEKVITMLEKFDKLIAKSDSNILIKDL